MDKRLRHAAIKIPPSPLPSSALLRLLTCTARVCPNTTHSMLSTRRPSNTLRSLASPTEKILPKNEEKDDTMMSYN